jgi:fatty acyl-CoA reductase
LTTFTDPIFGWTDNFYAINGAAIGGGTGVLRVLLIKFNQIVDVIPADYVIGSTLAAAWYTKSKCLEYGIFNCTTSEDNTTSWAQLYGYMEIYKNVVHPPRRLWVLATHFVQYEFVYRLYTIVYHFLPGVFFDSIFWLKGEKPGVLKLYRKVTSFFSSMVFFTMNEWIFRCGNMRSLVKALTIEEKKMFPCDVKSFSWEHFVLVYLRGLNQHVLKAKPEDCARSKRRYKYILVLHYLITAMWLAVFTYLLFYFFVAV